MKIAVCGYFAKKKSFLSGQIVKTRIVTKELRESLTADQVYEIDTAGKINVIFMFLRTIYALFACKNVAIFPAQNALPVLAAWLGCWNILFKKGLHYVVIGGWLPEYLDQHKLTLRFLRTFKGVYVETSNMKHALEIRGLSNVFVMPNCKELNIIENIQEQNGKTLKLVTFSRIMKEKGIEYAIDAVKRANEIVGRQLFFLDIYGQVDSMQIEWFNDVKRNMPSYVKFKGLIPFDKSTEVLKDYHALLFPTYYEGEGFAGTLIDGFAAGLPSITSDWRYNKEIVKNKRNGLLVPVHDVVALSNAIVWTCQHLEEWNAIRVNCLKEAEEYLPENVVPTIVNNLF